MPPAERTGPPQQVAHVSPSGPAIRTEGLVKTFGSVPAVDGIDLLVPRGSVYGFLGPNGSGKTTTIRMLLGLIAPTAGSWELLGQPMPSPGLRTLLRVGALVEGPAFYPWLSGRDNLARLDAAGPDPQRATRGRRIDEALARVGLGAAAAKKYKAYSLGMRQRLGLAAALLRPRDLLVLDEPTNGMDPQGTREIRHLVRAVAAEGATVFLSSHLLSEVEQVCTHAAVMSLGKILAQGELSELRSGGTASLRVEVDEPARAAQVLEALGLGDVRVTGAEVVAKLGSLGPEQANRELVTAGIGVRGLAVERPSLEDLFVALTGEGFDVAR